MKRNKQITPLSKFPTEAILMNYRRHRFCNTILPWKVVKRLNKYYEWEYWEGFTGPFEIDSKIYDPVIIGYTRRTIEEIHKKYTKIKGNIYTSSSEDDFLAVFSDEMEFSFDGMYWRGTIDEIKSELSRRPHVNIKGRKGFRRWKKEYNRTNKR